MKEFQETDVDGRGGRLPSVSTCNLPLALPENILRTAIAATRAGERALGLYSPA